MKNYYKVLYKINGKEVSEQEAKKNDVYEIYYCIDDKQVDKIEVYYGIIMPKVVYPDRDKPFNTLLSEHFSEYPNIAIDIRTKEVMQSNEFKCFISYIYSSNRRLAAISRWVIDKNDRMIREINLDFTNEEELGSSEYIYNEAGDLIKIIEYAKNGEKIGEQEFS